MTIDDRGFLDTRISTYTYTAIPYAIELLGLGLILEPSALSLILIHLSEHNFLIGYLGSQISRLASNKEEVSNTGMVRSCLGVTVRCWHFGEPNPSPNVAYPSEYL